MSKQLTKPIPRWAAVVLILALLTLLTVVAIGARRIPSTTVDSQLPSDSHALGQIVTWMSWAMMAVVVIWLMLPGGGRRRRRQAPKRGSWIASVLVMIALLIVFMQLGKASPELATEEPTISLPDVRDTTVVSLHPRTTLPAGSPTTLLIVVGAVVMAVAALSAIGRVRDDEAAATSIEGPGFTGVIDDLLAELEQSGDPRLIVIGAYARMEQALARDGVARRAAETPLEFLDRALRHLHVSGRAVRHLTALFAEARFSPHIIDEGMSAQAIAALRDVRGELRARI